MNDEDRLVTPKMAQAIDRHWIAATAVGWLLFCAYLLYRKWAAINGFALADTDDNMRLQQVRDWLAGQGWFDLRQHRLDPALGGANIHWSRIVDLPLAGLILLFKPFLATHEAERMAITIAPLLPLLGTLFALALVVRRLVHRAAYPLAIIALGLAGSTIGAFYPTRIDHHNWQLMSLTLVLAGLVDPKAARGGVVAGLACGLSLAIGLEMLIYLALAGVVIVLGWVALGRDEEARVAGFAAALVAAIIPGYLLFASNDNRFAVCDALSPVWLADALAGGALLIALVFAGRAAPGRSWQGRLALAVAAGAAAIAFHALFSPQCLSRLEGVSPLANQLWLSNVKEARPFNAHSPEVALMIIGLPLTGLAGYALLGWRWRRERSGTPGRWRALGAVGLLALASTLLLFWQTRAGPAAQLLAVPGAIAIIVLLAAFAEASRFLLVRVFGVLAIALLGLGVLPPLLATLLPTEDVPVKTRAGKALKRLQKASNKCQTEPALAQLDRIPAATMLTQVDLSPRLLTMTHHRAIAGPYHRNDDAIADVMLAFRGTPERALETVRRHRADYVLLCPGMGETTVYAARAPKGFYVQLTTGRAPQWLQPVALPKGSPFRLWKVVG